MFPPLTHLNYIYIIIALFESFVKVCTAFRFRIRSNVEFD